MGARLQALADNPPWLAAATVIVLLLLIPAIVLPAMLLLAEEPDGGAIALLVLLLAGGLYALTDLWHKTGSSAGVDAFARTNGLAVSRSVEARHYAGSRFRSGGGSSWSPCAPASRCSSRSATAGRPPPRRSPSRRLASGPGRPACPGPSRPADHSSSPRSTVTCASSPTRISSR